MRQVRQQMHVHGGVRRQQIDSEAGLVKKREVTRGTATEACKIMKWRPRPSLHLARTAPRAPNQPWNFHIFCAGFGERGAGRVLIGPPRLRRPSLIGNPWGRAGMEGRHCRHDARCLISLRWMRWSTLRCCPQQFEAAYLTKDSGGVPGVWSRTRISIRQFAPKIRRDPLA